MTKKQNLSKGLQSLLGGVIGIESHEGQEVIMQLNPLDIQPSNLQPRGNFDDTELKGLVESIKSHGILQPVIVRPLLHGYMLIAGERRWRAAKQLGMKEIPALVRQTDDLTTLQIAMIENIQREDLNPIEKAKGFQELVKRFNLTQDQVSKAMGKDRSSVSNYIRLLDLPEEIQDFVFRGVLSMGHARALLSIHEKEKQVILAERIIKEGLSVREVENAVSAEKKKRISSLPQEKTTPHVKDLEDRFRRHFGSKVTILEKNGKGRITIAFHNSEEFGRIAAILGITP